MANQEYELLYILDSDLSEEDQTQQNQRIRNQIEQADGKIVSESIWGRRLLGYEINKKREGIYFYLVVDMSGDATKQLIKFLQTESRVIRHIIVAITKAKRAEEARVAELQEARRAEMEAEAARAARRAAEAEAAAAAAAEAKAAEAAEAAAAEAKAAEAEQSEEGSEETSEQEQPEAVEENTAEVDEEEESDDSDSDVEEDV